MLLEVRTTGEGLFTNFAFVRLLSCMNPLVPNQIRNLAEPSSTTFKVADIRFLLVMHPLMLLEGR